MFVWRQLQKPLPYGLVRQHFTSGKALFDMPDFAGVSCGQVVKLDSATRPALASWRISSATKIAPYDNTSSSYGMRQPFDWTEIACN